MKKILPIISVLGASVLLAGCSSGNPISNVSEDFKSNIYNFKEQIEGYSVIQNNKITQTALNKYYLSLNNTIESIENETTTLDEVQTLENTDEETPAYDISDLARETNESQDNSAETNEIISENNISNEDSTPIDENTDEAIENELDEDSSTSEISTLYYLNEDIEDSCEEFCELKDEITEAIVETENLINKIQNKEIELSREQRIFLTNQSEQLKNLSRQLSTATNELSFSLSELNSLISSNENIDDISLKYLVILNNLINGNEMLQNGLSSLNMINNVFRMSQNPMAENNKGRILYGFQRNNQPPVIKDYIINENGEVLENKSNENIEAETNETITTASENEDNKKNTDSYKNSKLQSNIDTYGNNGNKNIDTFFNTALLDNEFMYGNGGYGYGYNNLGGYPYLAQQNYQYAQNNQQRTVSDDNNTSTQDTAKPAELKKEKKFRIQKNVDTYRDEKTPSLKTKFSNIKNSVTGFFNRFKPNKNVEFPVYKEPLDEITE